VDVRGPTAINEGHSSTGLMSRKKGRKEKTQGAQAAGAGSVGSNMGDTGTGGGSRGNTGGEKPQDASSNAVPFVPLSRSSSRTSIVSAALAQARESAIGRTRGSLDRGTLAQCLNATSQIAAECNRILRELLRGSAAMRDQDGGGDAQVGTQDGQSGQGGQGGQDGQGRDWRASSAEQRNELAALSSELLSQQNIDLRVLWRKMEGQQSTLAELLRVLRPKSVQEAQSQLMLQGGSDEKGARGLASDGPCTSHPLQPPSAPLPALPAMSNLLPPVPSMSSSGVNIRHQQQDVSSSSYSIVRYGLSWERAWGLERNGKGGASGGGAHHAHPKKRGGQGGKQRHGSQVSFLSAKERYQAVEGYVVVAVGGGGGGGGVY
jgi:hypothetical protein